MPIASVPIVGAPESRHHIVNRVPVACILQPTANIYTGTEPSQVIIVKIRHILLVLLCTLLAAAPVAAKTYYKWTDDIGTVHFSAEPPNDREYEIVNTSGRITSIPSEQSETSQESAQDAAGDVQMPRQAAPDPQVVAARCEQARENLFWLQSNRRIIIENDDGSETFIDADEQQRMIEENQALIEEWCQNDG